MSRILADTSVWISHFRSPDLRMTDVVAGNLLIMHPMVTGELAMGNLHRRQRLLHQMTEMDQAIGAADHEVLAFVERHALFGLGLGWTDAHLLVSTLLTPDCDLWTRDARLDAAASRFGRAARFHH